MIVIQYGYDMYPFLNRTSHDFSNPSVERLKSKTQAESKQSRSDCIEISSLILNLYCRIRYFPLPHPQK